jgi:2',3'-cyclic-nucleotide 2'-phosphodiesterase (5'-nucleotidase family)
MRSIRGLHVFAHHRLRYIAAGLAASLLLAACGSSNNNKDDGGAGGGPDPLSLTLLHTNDMHARWEAFGSGGSLGGLARLSTAVEGVRAAVGEDSVLLVDAGDYFQGTLFFNAWRGSDAVMALNTLRYDVVTLGNHEFDLGPEGLAAAMRGDPIEIAGVGYQTESIGMPVVVTNLDYSAEPELASASWLNDSVVIEKAGHRIGVLGVITNTTTNIASPGPNIQFLDYVESVQAEVDRLTSEGVKHIVLLSHVNHRDDLLLAEQLSGVDIIVSGHDHQLLGDADAIASDPLTSAFADLVAGPYPAVVTGADGRNVMVVSAWEWGRTVGRLDVTFDEQGQVVTWAGGPVFINESIAADPAVAAKVAEYRGPVDDLAGVPIGTAGTFFDGDRAVVRSQEASLGNLVTDVILSYAGPAYGADVVLTNGGGIRATIEQGAVTFGDALAVLPFGNTIAVVDLTGEELVAALDNGLTWAYDADSNSTRSSGAFPQVAGMTVTYCGESVADIQANTLPPRACATSILPNGVVTDVRIDGASIELSGTYRLASNNFLIINGGDFYSMFREACFREGGFCEDSFVVMLDELVREFAENSPVTRAVEGRLVAQ